MNHGNVYPKRVQRKRTKGFKMPENTVYVGRPTKFGNPYKVQDFLIESGQDLQNQGFEGMEHTRHWGNYAYGLMFQAYRNHLEEKGLIETIKKELRGKNLACWCALDKPCHVDILLKIANN